MFRLVTSLIVLSFFVSQPAFADDHGSDFAQYNVSVSGSPFGGSLNFAYNESPKTSWFFALGGLPGLELEQDIDGTTYTVDGSSSWVGFFINHRPLENADWFRLVAGIGIGTIENELKDENGNRYSANYKENPVGYLGIGFGSRALKGLQLGLDIGWLQTSGPQVKQIAGDDNAEALTSISDHFLFGSALPNVQFTAGWGF